MAIVPEQLDGANITQDTARIGLINGDSRFIRGYLEMPAPKKFIASHTLGVAVQGINLGDVRRISVAYPPENEQSLIGNVLEAEENYVRREKSYLNKLQTQKTGLMQDLLTGKVRVKIDESEEISANV